MAASKAPRKTANASESKTGLLGQNTTDMARMFDMFTNQAARQGFGTPSLGQGASYELVRFSYDYWSLITLFRNHWISRKIVEVPAQDMVKAWPKLTSDVEPKDLTRIDRALRKTNTKNNVLTALTWARLFGGAGALMIVDGQEDDLDQPLDLDSIKIGAFKGVVPFDRWAGITPVGDVCTDVMRPLDFNKPEMYEVRVAGGESFQVHASRLLRFLGPTVPTPELEAQSYWGISVLEPTYESITKLDNMSWNILGLTFRANLLGMEFPQLDQVLSGLGGSQEANRKMLQRLESMNHLMSNQSLIPLPKDGDIKAATYSFGGLAEIFQLFQLDLSGSSGIPVARLWGRTYNGLGQTGDGDERIYEEKIATDQATYLVPQLEKLYPVLCMSELGEVPEDLDLVCPSIRVLDEKEKAELAKSVADTTTVYLNGGIMSPRVVAREVKQSSDITGIGTNLTDEDIEKLPDAPQSEGELGEGLFNGEGAGLGEADSPAKSIKLENKAGKEEEGPKTAPAMDVAPSGLRDGEKLLVNGRLLTVAKVVTGTKDLFGEPTVQVWFETGEIIAYRPDGDLKVRAKAMDAAEKCGVPEWRTCPSCEGRIHRASCAVKLHKDRDCCKERGCRFSMLRHGQPTMPNGKARDANGPSTKHADMNLYHGLPVRVETEAGRTRHGKTEDGRPWSVNMPADYGFIEGIQGADGDDLDCYVGPSPESSNVYVVDQRNLDGKGFDEHKVMLGFHTQESAVEDYMAGHHLSKKVFAGVTPFTMPMFRKWMANHDMSKPCSTAAR